MPPACWVTLTVNAPGLATLMNTSTLPKVFQRAGVLLDGGVNNARYHPVWASLARDYLSIMATSVSSERAFSHGGLTITKHRNRLKGDIVEALQSLKCAVRHDLLFKEPGPSTLDTCDDEHDTQHAKEKQDEPGWDKLLSDDGEENDFDMDIALDSDW
ncbi:hypothetical protein H0H92_008100 [Tricholoma furcatifolium]|nr:hypothetical protein H0H92_008100 [Tricholoma furcatifolium]